MLGMTPFYAKGAASLVVDVNGNKKPNMMGRDIFYLILTNEGKVEPFGSLASAIETCNEYKKRFNTYDFEACINQRRVKGNSGDDTIFTCKNGYGAGATCAARIIENGWKMDY